MRWQRHLHVQSIVVSHQEVVIWRSCIFIFILAGLSKKVAVKRAMLDARKRMKPAALYDIQRFGTWIIVIGVFLISGCSELVLKDHDDGAAIIGKVMYRTVFAIGTLGISEIKMAEATREYEREQKLKAYETRVMEFLEKGEISQAEAEQLIRKERARLWNEEG